MNRHQQVIQTYFYKYIILVSLHLGSWGSSVNIVFGYVLDDRGSVPGRIKGFSSSFCVQTSFEAHSASYLMGTGGPLPGGKAQPGRDADLSPPSSAVVKYE
jgi:hypothetical protein